MPGAYAPTEVRTASHLPGSGTAAGTSAAAHAAAGPAGTQPPQAAAAHGGQGPQEGAAPGSSGPQAGAGASGPPAGAAWAGSRPPRSDAFRDFIRQKPAQIIGAGLIGLVIGGLLGGGAVALIGGIAHRSIGYAHWEGLPGRDGWGPHRGPVHRYPDFPDCRAVPGGTYCRDQGPYVYPPYAVPTPWPSMAPKPLPTIMPTTPLPVPTRTG
ncbi:hypothetical protein ABT294_01440 [Nonomuraea sp. NPDC000554]|uniref:hypothetical protein n=1 Tax=Nonomuraea sp. NPDC000554 TaxID=3154259 RepID=UPI00332AE504